MRADLLRTLRESGVTLRVIGQRHYHPPVSYEKVRRDCMRLGIVEGPCGPSQAKVRQWGMYRLPKIDQARAQEITESKRRYWLGGAA